MCPMHSEAKQSKTLEFGAEKGVLQCHARRTGGSCSRPELPDGIQGRVYKGNVREENHGVCDQLVHNPLDDGKATRWCHRG